MTTPATPDFAADMLAGMDKLGSGGPLPEASHVADTDGDDTAATGADGADAGADADGAGGDDGAEGGAAGAGDGTGPAAGEAGADEGSDVDAAGNARPRNADGTFKSAEQIAADTAAAGTQPLVAAAAPAKPAGKVADPVNDPIPKDLKPATAARMTALVTTAKELTTRAEQAEQDRDLLLNSVKDTGMDGQQFGEFLAVVKDARSNDPALMQSAYDYLTSVLGTIATSLGKAPPGVDPLTGFDDLIQRVNGRTLARADAEDIANARRQQTAVQTRTQAQQTAQERTQAQQQEMQTAMVTGRTAMAELEQTLAGADPQFAAKKAVLMKDPVFIQQLKGTHPSQWTAVFGKKYRETKVTPPTVRPVAVAAGGAQPLRGKPPAGGSQVTAPKSIEAAMGAIDFSKV